MKKIVFKSGISLLVGFSLAIGIANYIIPLFWDRRLIVKLGFLGAATIFLSIIAYLIIAWIKNRRHSIVELAGNLRIVIKKNPNLFMLVYIVLVGFSLAIGIASYLIPLFWDRRLIVKLGFLGAATLFLSIIAYLIIAWIRYRRHSIVELTGNLRIVIKKNPNLFMLVYIVLVGIASFVLLCWITPDGSGVSPDSTIYMDTARNLLKGAGFYALGEPLTTQPPLYPVFLAVANLLEHNIILAAGILNALLFAINIGLVAWMVYAASRNFLASTAAILFLLSSSAFLSLHLAALSEPLFITLTLASIIFLSMYHINPALPMLIPASVCLGLAVLTRYIGAAFLPAALIIVFFGGNQRRIGQGIRDTIIFLVLACIPIGIWSIRNLLVAGTIADRVVVFHPVSASKLEKIVIDTHDFILPIKIPNWIKMVDFGLLSALLIVVLVIFLKKRFFRGINWHSMGIVMTISCGLFTISYLLFLIISLSFFDAYTPINSRLLSPVFVLLILAAFTVTWDVSQKLKKPAVWWCFLLFVAFSISINTPITIKTATNFRRNNSGFTTSAWRNSQTLAFVNSFPGDAKIFSNGFDILDLMTGKAARRFPNKIDPTSQLVNQNYEQEISGMCKDIRENKALVVFFTQLNWRTYFPTQAELASDCQLSVLKHLADGTVYGAK
jgi:hypothetical protein